MKNIIQYSHFNESHAKWSKDMCQEIALLYNSRNEFKVNNGKAYQVALRNKWMDVICSHMKPPMKKNYWSKEKCHEEALKYKSRSEFEKRCPSAYVKSGVNGWMDEICSHMQVSGNLYNRCIYAIEFPDNTAYIGLTYNFDKRFNQHLGDTNSVVLKHHLKTGLFPIIRQLTDYIDVNDASKMEEIKKQEYIENGWDILNISKCGNIGGKTVKWTKERCQIEALKYESRNEFKIKSKDAYHAARHSKWIDEICSHMKYKNKSWSKDSCKGAASKCKNRDEFKRVNSGAFSHSYRHKYLDEFFPKTNESMKYKNGIPTYKECIEICQEPDSPFYESKLVVNSYRISLFNYRLAQYNDFIAPHPLNKNITGKELRGLCFVFNDDGSIFERYVLLEKFFNLNQVPESMYSVVKDYEIKFVNIKEDGSIASFIKLPNGKIVGRSKMGFDNDQAKGINRVYNRNSEVHEFVNWCMNNNISPIMEFVAPHNRIVLPYSKEELILLRLRDNKTGDHLNIKDYLDKIGSIKIAPFIDDFKSLDELVETSSKEEGKEGYVVTTQDKEGKNFFYKIKTPWYQALHGVLTNDLYRENTIIKYIIEDRIDDVLGQVPEDDKETHNRINRIIGLVKKFLYEKADKVQALYDVFMASDSVKQFAIKYKNHPEFAFVMNLDKINRMMTLTDEEKIKHYGSIEKFEQTLANLDKYEQVKKYIENVTKRLEMARIWLKKIDPTIKFQDYAGDPDEN